MTQNRIFNFSAGPSMLPVEVLEKASFEMLNYEGFGMSVMEMSHRSKVYESIINSAKTKLRTILNIPENYEILFLQGGASGQFSAIPLNLLKTGTADYITTGQFSTKAYKEAQKYGDIKLAGSSKDKNFSYIPKQEELTLNPNADYLHICENNTIYGTKWNYIPKTNAPLVSDMSSCILSEVIDVSKYDVIYAGAQKNMGPAGLTVVIIKRDLITDSKQYTPVIFDYKTVAENDSMYNTPPTYAIYIFKLVLEWIENIGGLSVLEEKNRKKAKILYDYLDNSKMFSPTAQKDCRSIMNITFVSSSKELDEKFIKEATACGFENLKGHRSVGGMRASIYNAMPLTGVEKLVEFMKKFEKEN